MTRLPVSQLLDKAFGFGRVAATGTAMALQLGRRAATWEPDSVEGRYSRERVGACRTL